MNENSTGPQRKRRRPAVSCEKCRRRKIRCDRNMPCDQCIRSKSDTCTYLSDDSPALTGRDRRVGVGGMTNSSTTSSTMSHESPSSAKILPATGVFEPLIDQLSAPGNSTTGPDKEHSSTVQALPGQLHQSRHKLPDPSRTEPTESATVSLPVHTTALPTKGVFSKARLFGQSHWMNSIEQV